MKTKSVVFLTLAFMAAAVYSSMGLENTPTQSILWVHKIRADGATLVGTWNPDGGDHGVSYWLDSGAAGTETATFAWTADDNTLWSAAEVEYDLGVVIKTGPDISTNELFTVNMKSNGSFELGSDPRITADTSSIAEGKLVISLDCSNTEDWPTWEHVYLGRFEFETADGSVVQSLPASISAVHHTPVHMWIAQTQPNYGTLAYSDANCLPMGWINPYGTDDPFLHYWENGDYNSDNVFKASEYTLLPSSDRQSNGIYEVTMSMWVMWYSQDVEVPLRLYFEPGGAFEVPSEAGHVISVDDTNASAGYVDIVVQFPTTTMDSPFDQIDFSLGSYEMNRDTAYGIHLKNWPPDSTPALGPQVFTLNLTQEINAAENWMVYE